MRIDYETQEFFVSDSELFNFALENHLPQSSTTPFDIANKMLRKERVSLSIIQELSRVGDCRVFKFAPRGSYLDRKVNLEDIQGFKNPPIHGGAQKLADEFNYTSVVEINPIEGSNSFKDLRDLLNYASKTVKNFSLTSASMSMTIDDIKYEVKVTK